MGPCFLILFVTRKTERAKVFLLRLVHALRSAQKFSSSLFSNSYLLTSYYLNWGWWEEEKMFSYMILPSDGNGLARRVLFVWKNIRKQTPLKIKKNNATSFSDIFQSEQNWAFSSRLMMLAQWLDAVQLYKYQRSNKVVGALVHWVVCREPSCLLA